MSEHFISWLNASDYEQYGFNRSQFIGGAFGGKQSDDDKVVKIPVIFVHGNGDLANGRIEDDQSGWKTSLEYFLSQGYTQAELYATSWGFGDIPHEPQHFHAAEYLIFLRKFIEAVLEYTQAP